MANLSDLTRKEQVLALLRENVNQWVDGPDLANEEVGGSEGLRRLRDLKAEGYLIQERPHPDRTRAVHQYRLVQQAGLYGDSDRPSLPPAEHGRSMPPGSYEQQRQFAGAPPKKPKEDKRDWQLESAIRSEYRCEFWIRNPKQRIIGTIALDFDRSRWFWSVKQPKYHGKYGETRPERTLGSGIVPVAYAAGGDPDLARRTAREEAKRAVESKVRELKEADSL